MRDLQTVLRHGYYVIKLIVNDSVKGTAQKTFTFTIDNTPPTISISAPSSSYAKTGNSVIYNVAYDDINFNQSTLTLANITLNRTGTANGTLTVVGTGKTRTVTIAGINGNGTVGISIAAGTASDLAGNLAPAAGPSPTVTIDNTAPTVTISNPSAILARRGSNVTYTVTYADTNFSRSTLASANITLNKTGTANGVVAVTGTSGNTRTVTISDISGDGSLGISIAAGSGVDLADNLALAAGPSKTFAIDNTPPVNPTFSLSTTGWTNGNVIATINYSTDSSVKQYSYDAMTWYTYTGAITVANNATIYARGTDNIGNQSGQAAVSVTNIDKTAPSIPTINLYGYASGTWTTGNVTQSYNSTDSQSGINRYQYSHDTVNWYDCPNPWLINWDGTWNFYIRAIDNAGNISGKSNVYSIYRDATVPTYTSYAITNVTTTGYDVYVYGISDNNSGINRIQFPTWTNYNGQDDIQSNWPTNPAASGTNQGNGTWYYRVNKSQHNNEDGYYNTHIYIYDSSGNCSAFVTPGATVHVHTDACYVHKHTAACYTTHYHSAYGGSCYSYYSYSYSCGGCQSGSYNCGGCQTSTSTTYCGGCSTRTRYCGGCESDAPNDPENAEYYCPGHGTESYCPGHTSTTTSCPGHSYSYCPGHSGSGFDLTCGITPGTPYLICGTAENLSYKCGF